MQQGNWPETARDFPAGQIWQNRLQTVLCWTDAVSRYFSFSISWSLSPPRRMMRRPVCLFAGFPSVLTSCLLFPVRLHLLSCLLPGAFRLSICYPICYLLPYEEIVNNMVSQKTDRKEGDRNVNCRRQEGDRKNTIPCIQLNGLSRRAGWRKWNPKNSKEKFKAKSKKNQREIQRKFKGKSEEIKENKIKYE